MQLFFIIALCVFNLAAWGVMFYKFKKLFNTDDIIDETKKSCETILSDLNRNVDRNITLINSRIEELGKLVKDADKRIKILTDIEKSSKGVTALKGQLESHISTQKLSTKINSTNTFTERLKMRAAQTYETQSLKKPTLSDLSDSEKIEISKSPEDIKAAEPLVPDRRIAASLEDDEYGDDFSRVGMTDFNSTNNLIAPSSFDNKDNFNNNLNDNDNVDESEENEINEDKAQEESTINISFNDNFNDKSTKKDMIKKLFLQGLDIDTIAQNLTCSTTEVQLILDMEGLS